MTATAFKRARKPEEIGIRRAAILSAAAALFDAEGPEGAGLNAIAARAGFTKSNVYRYFESREAMLLSLFLADFAALAGDLEARLAAIEPGDTDAVARVSAAVFLERPRVCKLLSILTGVLERNVSELAVVALKTEMLGLTGRLAAAMHRALPTLPIEDCAWGAAVIGTFVSGLWPAANPTDVVGRVLARPEFAALKPSAERDLQRTIQTLLRGMTSTPAAIDPTARAPE